jgi:hypothetical protein
VPDAVVCCALASTLTRWTSQRGWRGIQIVCVQGLALACFLLRDVQLAWSAAEPFFGFAWLGRLASDAGPLPPLPFVMLALTTLALWWSGVLHARRPRSYREICARFDLGLYWLFGLLFVRLLLRAEPAVPKTDPIADALVPGFFGFGVCAIAIARHRAGAAQQVRTGARGLGVLLGVGSAALLGSAGTALLLLPYLRALSQRSHAEVATRAAPIANRAAAAVIDTLHWLLAHPLPLYTPGRTVTVANVVSARVIASTPPERLTQSDPHSLWIALGLASSCALVLLALRHRRWLWARTQRRPRAPSRPWLLLRQVWQRVLALWHKLLSARELEPIRLYRALLRWGERTGLPRAAHETPLEYAARLKRHLVVSGADIDLIVATFNLHVYAGPLRDPRALARAAEALRRLHSPRLWIRRCVIRFRSVPGATW